MSEAEPWSYHADGSPVYSLADIIRKRSAITPGDHVPAEEFAHRLRSAGRPMRGARVRVIDPSRWRTARSASAARSWWPARAS